MEDTICLLRFYNERLNKDPFPELLKEVADKTNLSLRRSNNRIANSFHDVSSKLISIGYHINSVNQRLILGQDMLPELLGDFNKDTIPDLTDEERFEIEKNVVAEFYDFILVSHLEGALVQSKALLDSISQMYSIAFSRDVRTFSSSGKNLIKDIQNLKQNFDSYKQEFISIIVEHKTNWIDEAIKYRDSVVHFGQLRGLRCQSLKLSGKKKYTVEDVAIATMPNGEIVLDYRSILVQ